MKKKKTTLICLLMSFLITGCGKGLKMTSGMPIKKEEKQQTQIQEKTDTVHTNNQVNEPSPTPNPTTDPDDTNNQSPTPNPTTDPDGGITTYDKPSMFERVTMHCPFLSQIVLSYVADIAFYNCGIALYALFPSLSVGGSHAILGFTLMSASYFIYPLASIAFAAYAYKKGATNLPLVLMSSNSLFSLLWGLNSYINR